MLDLYFNDGKPSYSLVRGNPDHGDGETIENVVCTARL